MISIHSEAQIINDLESFRIGVVEATIECRISSFELLGLMQNRVQKTRDLYKLEDCKEIPNIKAARVAYRKTGNDPNRYRPSADSLTRRIVKGLGLYSVNNIVDVLNIVSVDSGFSISGFDGSKISGGIHFGIGLAGELYHGIGRGEININNLPAIRDQLGAIGTPTSDSIRTMITLETEFIVFIFYDFGNNSGLEPAIHQCRDLLFRHCSLKDFRSEVQSFNKNV